MTNYTKYFVFMALMALAAFVQSCSTTYIAEIKPVGISTFSEGGSTVASMAKSGLEMYMTYLDHPPGMLLFDVQATNRSGYPLKINTADL